MRSHSRLPHLLLTTILVSGLLGAIQVRADTAPLSQGLARLSPVDRQNARIELHLAATAETSDAQDAADIAVAWNGGESDAALFLLRRLEEAAPSSILAVGIQWLVPRAVRAGGDRDGYQIGLREHVRNVDLDGLATGFMDDNLYSVLTFDLADGGGGWSVNISTEYGFQWQETYVWLSTSLVNDAGGRVGGGFLYVAYTAPAGGDNSSVFAQRFHLADGSPDESYSHQTVGLFPAAVTDVALETNAEGDNDRLFCLAILADHSLVMRAASTPGFAWTPVDLGISDARDGLDAQWNVDPEGPDLFASYRTQNGRVHLLTYSDTPTPSYSVLDLDDATGPTSVAAVNGHLLAVYEYAYPGGNGIRGQMSHDGGATWSIDDIAVPSAGESFFVPRVAGRGGWTFGLIYQQQGGGPDRVWFAYSDPLGIPGLDGQDRDWNVLWQVNEVDVAVGTAMAVEVVPPAVTDILASFGLIFIGSDTVDRGAFFNRVDFGDPWGPYGSYVSAYPGPASVFTTPDGGGQPLSACNAAGGVVVDATITVTLVDFFGNPIAFYPSEDIWLETERGGLVTCTGGSIADGATGPDGQTTFSQPIAGGGHSDLAGDERTLVIVAGMPLEQRGLPISFNSADINGDLHVNLTDVSLFAQDYFGSYAYRSDFAWDGAINLADLSRLASALSAACSNGEPAPAQAAPVVGEVAVSFARDALLTSLAVAPGQVFQAHLLVTGPAAASGIVGLQGSLRTTDNLEIVRWTFASRQINVAEAPAFAVGFAEPQVQKADRPVCALTVELRAKDDQPAAIYLNFDPATGLDQGPVLCALGQDAALARLSRRDRGDAAAPAARVNSLDETAASSTPPSGLVDGSLHNAPNPFNPSTDIHFDLARAGRVEVRIYDAGGRLVRRLAGEMRDAGSGSVHWDGRDEQGQALASGLYFSQLVVDGATAGRTVKMSLVR